MALANPGTWITRRLGDAMLGCVLVCVVAFCFGFRAYLLPCFAKVLLAIVDVNCRALGHFEM